MFLCNFTEYGADNGVSIKQRCEDKPYAGMDKIVSYLRNKGKQTLVSMRTPIDRISGERIRGEYNVVHLTDGEYTWCSDLAYHVEKYNLRLPKEFEEHVLNSK